MGSMNRPPSQNLYPAAVELNANFKAAPNSRTNEESDTKDQWLCWSSIKLSSVTVDFTRIKKTHTNWRCSTNANQLTHTQLYIKKDAKKDTSNWRSAITAAGSKSIVCINNALNGPGQLPSLSLMVLPSPFQPTFPAFLVHLHSLNIFFSK